MYIIESSSFYRRWMFVAHDYSVQNHHEFTSDKILSMHNDECPTNNTDK